MLARTRLKLKNAESTISFMQEQHANTLEELHKEIEKLQKKNASMMLIFYNLLFVMYIHLLLPLIGLSFQLTMTGRKTSAGKLE